MTRKVVKSIKVDQEVIDWIATQPPQFKFSAYIRHLMEKDIMYQKRLKYRGKYY